MKVVDVPVATPVDGELTGARLVADLEAAGADRALVVMVRSGLRIIADHILAIDPDASDLAYLVDPDPDA